MTKHTVLKNIKSAFGVMLAFLTIVSVSSPSSALACSCIMQPESNAQAVSQSAAIFAGKLKQVKESGGVTGGTNTLVFETSRTWKGPNAKTIEVKTASNSAACGWMPEANKEYLVYAYTIEDGSVAPNGNQGDLGVGLCGRSMPLSEAGKDLAALGAGTVTGASAQPAQPTQGGTSGSAGFPAGSPAVASGSVGGEVTSGMPVDDVTDDIFSMENFLASLWGPVLLAIGLGVFFSRSYYVMVYRDLEKETLAVFTLGIAGIALGIIQISSFNAWDTFTSGLISFLGWGTLAKGLVFTIFPKLADKGGDAFLNTSMLPAAGVVMIALGAYLSWFAYLA